MTAHRVPLVQRLLYVLSIPLAGLLIGALIGAAAGTAWAATRKTEYTATTVYYLRPPVTTDATQALTADIYAFNRAKLYVSLMTSTELAERVSKRIESKSPPSQLASSISASDIYQTALITTIVTASSSDEALRIANGYAAELPGYAGRVEKDSGLPKSEGLITVADGPSLSSSGSGPVETVSLAVVLSALLGIAGSLWYRRRFLIVDSLSVADSTGMPVYDQVDLRDQSAVDRLVARLLGEQDVNGHLTIVSPYLRDGAGILASALSSSYERLGVGTQPQGRHTGPTLALDSQGILEETAISRGTTQGPALLAIRKSATSKRDLAATARLLSANSSQPLLGVVLIKRADKPSANEAPMSTSAESRAIPVKA